MKTFALVVLALGIVLGATASFAGPVKHKHVGKAHAARYVSNNGLPPGYTFPLILGMW